MALAPAQADAALTFDIVVPSIGRPSLDALLTALVGQAEELTGRLVLVDDRPALARASPLDDRVPAELAPRTTVVQSGGRGPAAARNCGWRVTRAPWVVFLDDDVVPGAGWARELAADLGDAADAVAVTARIDVPLPTERRPTDRERSVARLATAPWITADIAVRRDVLTELGGFDERFRRAYREDTDLHLRACALGHRFVQGGRRTTHPVGPAPWWASVAAQRGNADDALLRALHGPATLNRGRRPRHALVTAAGVLAIAAALAGRRRLVPLAAGAWAAGSAEFAWVRIRPGPRTGREVAAMVVTSVAIPPVACWHWVAGRIRWRRRAMGHNGHSFVAWGGARRARTTPHGPAPS